MIEVSTDFRLAVATLSRCPASRSQTVRGNVDGDRDIARVSYTLNGGAPVTLCTSCGADPPFSFPVTLADCLNRIEVTAEDVALARATVTSFASFAWCR